MCLYSISLIHIQQIFQMLVRMPSDTIAEVRQVWFSLNAVECMAKMNDE